MKNLAKGLTNLDYVIQPLIMVTLLVILAGQVLYRFIPNLSLPWTLELITFLFGAMVWFGVSIAIKENAHVGITYFLDRLPPRGRLYMQVFHNVLFGIYLIAVGWFGTNTLIYYVLKDIRTPAMQWSYALVRAPLFFGCILSLYRLVEKTIEIVKAGDGEATDSR